MYTVVIEHSKHSIRKLINKIFKKYRKISTRESFVSEGNIKSLVMEKIVRIGALIALIIVFAVLYQISSKWRSEELPLVRLCCKNETNCEDLNEITSKSINAEWNHDTKYEVIKGMPPCDLGFYDRSNFFINKVKIVKTRYRSVIR